MKNLQINMMGRSEPRPTTGLTGRMSACGLFAAMIGTGGLAFAQTFEASDLSGEELFSRYCAACHGPEGMGNGPVAGSLNKRVPDLRVLARNAGGEFPAMAVREAIDGRALAIAHGTRQMPVWGYEFWVEEGADIDAEQAAKLIIDRIVSHVESIQISEEEAVAR